MALRKVAPTLFRRPAGDEAAFERLYERHVEGVYRYSLGMLGDAGDAEDVTQTTFLNAYRAFKNGTRPDKPQSWLIAIAHNVCRQRFRQAQRRPREVAFDDGIGEAEAVEAAGPTAEDLRRALSQLPPNQRAALVMRELEGGSYSEIADVLGVSVSALETLLFRARRALREQLEEQISCEQAALSINRQLDGRLSMGERRSLRAHLRACPECHSLAQSQRAQRRALKSLVLVPLPLTIAHWSGAQSASAATGAGGLAAVGATTGGAGMSSVVFGGVAAKVAAVVVAGIVVGGGTYEGVRAAGAAGGANAAVQAPHAKPTPVVQRTKAAFASRRVPVAHATAHARHSNPVVHATKGPHRAVAAAQHVVRGAPRAATVEAGSTADAAGANPPEHVATSNAAAPAHASGASSGSQSGANPQALSNPQAAANSQAPDHSQAASHSNAAAHEQASNHPEAAPASAPDASPGNSANAPGHAETPPGNADNAPGHSDTPPGNSGDAPGHADPPGNSGNAPGHADPPGNSGNAPGRAGDTQPTTPTAPSQGNNGDGSHGK